MIRVTVKGLGEIPLFVNKGAIGEYEDYFGKTWFQIVANGMNFKHWIVLIHRCYQVACYREKKEPVHSLKDFESFIEDEDFNTMVKLVDEELEKVLELSKISEKIAESAKGAKKKR